MYLGQKAISAPCCLDLLYSTFENRKHAKAGMNASQARSLCHLSETRARIFFRDVALGDVLLEGREERAEEAVVFPKEACLCNAAGVQRREHDARVLVEAAVHLAHRQHVTDLQAGCLNSLHLQLFLRISCLSCQRQCQKV